MKKLLILALLFVAIASYGGMNLAHAQSLTPAQTAALQQQLDVAKAQLVQLQMQQGAVPAGDNNLPANTSATVAPSATVMPSATLSASDVASINSALTALTGVLTSLQSEIASNPQMIATNGAGVVAALQGVGNTLAIIGSDIQNGNVAMTQPSTVATTPASPVAVAPSTGSGAQITVNSAPSTAPTTAPVVSAPTTAPAATTPAATTPTQTQTAQGSSSFSASKLNWPLIIVIVLIVAAIAIWLWWDDSDEAKNKPVVVKNISSAPQKPVQPLQMSNQQSSTPNRESSPASTPLSSAMGPQQKKTA